ncbi:hypothetical protein GUITHDRAFT_157786 [Guillardia theta CCMP2712]|uniref:Superoxide dismutase n=1 Tax=Guillardia theta (strain CCMP2712) TaxID=905079 RepID=L1JD25_GUITC|nr:hypothetical protein GUITHDRAFT_157786 [Guillardia theta CCMP2712]EKX46005.1 hypothetical protein GUITHDRAFT_157786 [Guillardia theta CCMP2712]|eukprot:XP_005832985.1 hypothetical protein GUITHDRAFT_157786 [Guillardia theta CCMP2712]
MITPAPVAECIVLQDCIQVPSTPGKSNGPFLLPNLLFGYSDLEPYIDQATMMYHYNKHFNGYMTNLNNALKGTLSANLTELVLNPTDSTIRNNGGGFYNHGLFFRIMCTASRSETPSKLLEDAIIKSFGSMAQMKQQFAAQASSRFGSGWVWLGVLPDGKLGITTTANQDTPFMKVQDIQYQLMYPFLGLDVWEHAYYLNYQNQRSSYVDAWWNIVNWSQVPKKNNSHPLHKT